jgi:hypothetical protein
MGTYSNDCIANSGLIDLEMLLLGNRMTGFDVHPMSLRDSHRSRAPFRLPAWRAPHIEMADLTAIRGYCALGGSPKSDFAWRGGWDCSGSSS